jgi:oligopeptide transport system substrate-binding protein
VRVNVGGDVALTDEMRDKGIRLLTSVKTSTFYMGFNMLDPVVGGLSLRSTKLRQAISIAIDQEEYISIFSNGRGIAAQGPCRRGSLVMKRRGGDRQRGLRLGDGKPKRKPVEVAKKLMAEAGYSRTAATKNRRAAGRQS